MLNVFVTLPTGGTFFSYLKRISDNLYLDESDDTFKAFASLVDGKINFVEDTDVPGQFNWSKDVPDGDYVIYTLEDTGGGDVNVAEAHLVQIRQGQEQTVSVVDFTQSGALEAEIVECG